MGCPKFDDINHYKKKLTVIFKYAGVSSITVAVMEVPCCSVLNRTVKEALKDSNMDIPLTEITISIHGERK